jgi:hypothetical protein
MKRLFVHDLLWSDGAFAIADLTLTQAETSRFLNPKSAIHNLQSASESLLAWINTGIEVAEIYLGVR